MKKAKKLARQLVILAIGLPLFVLGIILIPLPGPGLLVCFLALFILSMEFEWAEKHLERVKKELKTIWDKSMSKRS